MQNFLASNKDIAASLSGVAVHRALPPGETLGASFEMNGETLYVTKPEIDRVKNMPSAEEIRHKVALIKEIMKGKPAD